MSAYSSVVILSVVTVYVAVSPRATIMGSMAVIVTEIPGVAFPVRIMLNENSIASTRTRSGLCFKMHTLVYNRMLTEDIKWYEKHV